MINKGIAEKIKPGTTVRVWEIIPASAGAVSGKSKNKKQKENEKDRLARFEGLVLARKHGNEIGATFTVRGTVAGVGVEKVFPIHSPAIDKVEILASAKNVRRAKLYYVRDLSRKSIRRKLGAKTD